MHLRCGDRVVVSHEYHWARDATGVVAEPPAEVVALSSGWHGCSRNVAGAAGVLRFYWVEFDEPQKDAEGHGPHTSAEIDERALSRPRDDGR